MKLLIVTLFVSLAASAQICQKGERLTADGRCLPVAHGISDPAPVEKCNDSGNITTTAPLSAPSCVPEKWLQKGLWSDDYSLAWVESSANPGRGMCIWRPLTRFAFSAMWVTKEQCIHGYEPQNGPLKKWDKRKAQSVIPCNKVPRYGVSD